MQIVEVDGIDVKDVKFIQKKITYVLERLNAFGKWSCKRKFYGVKQLCLKKLNEQLAFLIRVQKLKLKE